MAKSRTALAIAVVAMALLSGCMGFLGGGGGTGTPTETPHPVNDSTTADAVRSAAVAAMNDVDTYVVHSHSVEDYTADVSQTARTNTTTRVNRTARRLNATQVQSTDDRTYTVETYLVNGTLYGFSDFYGSEYGSDWIRATPPSFERAWERRDTLSRQRAVLTAANVTLAGTQTVDGVETYVLDATLSDEQYGALLDEVLADPTRNVTVREATFRFWIAQDTDLPVKSTASITLVLPKETPNATVEQTTTLHFERYGANLSVTLPSGASDAKNVTERLFGSASLVPPRLGALSATPGASDRPRRARSVAG